MKTLLLHRSGQFVYGIIIGQHVIVRSGNRGNMSGQTHKISIQEFSNIYW